VIETINTYRDPQPEFEALYMLMATSQNIERIIKDFTGTRQYAAAHLFFIDGTSLHLIMCL
jgi:syntaxin-binding protein 1